MANIVNGQVRIHVQHIRVSAVHDTAVHRPLFLPQSPTYDILCLITRN